MKIGIPKEIKDNEYRVGIVPSGVEELVSDSHEVLIQAGAGLGSGITDEDFVSAGAVILPDAGSIWSVVDLVMKVKEPLQEEYDLLKDNQILLARNKRFKLPFYSVLAGFVEPGESLEECVQREICEEVGLTVKNIRYFGSQPWPFPNSLMIAFVAEYAEGDIMIDGSEIIDAAWFSKDKLPQIPPTISIARQLIDWFTET